MESISSKQTSVLIEREKYLIKTLGPSKEQLTFLEIQKNSKKALGNVPIDVDRIYTEVEYLELCRKYPDIILEYAYGYIICMATPDPWHGFIVDGLSENFKEFWGRNGKLGGKDCKYNAQSAVAYENPKKRFSNDKYWRVPDLIRICGTIKTRKVFINGTASTAILNPDIIVEIVSESTRKTDIEVKSVDYKKMKSMKYYIAIDYLKNKIIIYPKKGKKITAKPNQSFSIAGAEFYVNEIFAMANFDEEKHEHLKIVK